MLFLTRILKIIEPLINYGVSLGSTLKILLLMLPTFLELTIPMALLLGGLLACGRLVEDGELLALRSSGQTTTSLSAPIWALSLVVFVFTGFLTVYAGPEANRQLKKSLLSVSKSHIGLSLQEGTFFDRIPNLVLYADEVSRPGGSLKGVLVSDSRDPSRPTVVLAKIGLLLGSGSNVIFRLIDGAVYSSEPKGGSFQKTDFNVYDLNVNLDPNLGSRGKRVRHSELSQKALMARITAKRAMGESTSKDRFELHRRFALPFSCLIFTLATVFFGLSNSKITRSKATVTALIIIALYFIAYAGGQRVASKGILPPLLGAWLPNILVGVVEIVVWLSKKEGRVSLFNVLRLNRGKKGSTFLTK